VIAAFSPRPGLLALAAALALCACRPGAPEADSPAQPSPEPPPAPGAASAPAAPPPPLTANPDADEIFRRAFWRRPTTRDRILHAERRETRSSADAPGSTLSDVERWQWFLAVHPSPELLAALRDPGTFGLAPVTAPRPWPDDPPPPRWFPAADALAGFEMLQATDAGLTVLYRTEGNLLYATDSGKGFAAPVSRP